MKSKPNGHNTHYKPLIVTSLFLTFSLFSTEPFAAVTEKTAQASSLIKSGDYNAAYQLLEPLEPEFSGDVDYDYLLGVAAVESGHVTRGIFALERVLAITPNNINARAEIAKAHFKLGEADTSKAEFQNILTEKPSEEVAKSVEKYMSAIDKALGLTTTFAAYLDFGLGYDTNVNSATSASSVAAPGFGGGNFTLTSAAREKSDGFINISGGISFRHPLSNTVAVFGTVNGNTHINNSETAFDTSTLDFNGGFQFKKNIDTYTIAAQDSHFDLDTVNFRRAYGLTGQWQRDFDQSNQGSLYTQISRLEYHGNEIRDANRYVIGSGWAHVFGGDKTPVVFVGAYIGQENTLDSRADFLSNDIYGLRSGGQLSITPKLVAYGSLGYEARRYNKTDPAFLKTRSDDQYDASLGLRFLPAHNWSIKPQISYIKNDSNIVINQFERTIVSINARKDFDW